ncbi:class II fructose-bisphosphate aldolase [Acidobacteriota bacterium]
MKFDTKRKLFAFNAPNLDSLLILIEITRNTRLSFIIQLSTKLVTFYGVDLINTIFRKHKNEAWFSLDHCDDIGLISRCTNENGWVSVLYDCSAKPLEENIRLSRIAKDICMRNGVLLESEITPLGINSYSTPEEAERFVNEVDCDLITISVGTGHGLQVGTDINLQLIKDVADRINKAIVIHGGSGIDDRILAKIFQHGANKINISTSLKNIYLNTIKKHSKYDFNNLNKVLYEAYYKFIKTKIKAGDETI